MSKIFFQKLIVILAVVLLNAQGRTDADGRRYDSSGRYQGHQDSSGRWYDQSGRYQGRESRDGSRYDSSGRYQGRTR